jgi:Spy/CpxP family protein refolding chaperone
MSKIIISMVAVIAALTLSLVSYADETGMMQKHFEKRDSIIKDSNLEASKKDAVLAVFHKYDTQRESVMQDQKKVNEELRKLIDEAKDNKKPDENTIQALLDKMEANMDKLHDIQKAQTKEIKGILKPSEQLKLLTQFRKAMGGDHWDKDNKGKGMMKGGPGGEGSGGPGPGMM